MDNVFLEFYGENDISPVKQDVSNIGIHCRKREKLYRQLGIPTMVFEGKKILEVGPGGGYNTLAFFEWGGRNIDLIEPNKKGREDMKILFSEHNIEESYYNIKSCTVEGFDFEDKYQIIIAEGFLPCIVDKRKVLDKLVDMVKDGGIIVITCIDEIGLFVEQMKRLIGHILTRNIDGFLEKTEALVKIFEPQLKNLNGMSRSIEDWVQDNLINPANNSDELFSISDAISYFSDEFDILGTSPNMFVDYSWYKDIQYDYKKNYLEQFTLKNHNFLMTGIEETILSVEENIFLKNVVKEIRNYAILYEKNKNKNNIDIIVKRLYDIVHIMNKIDKKLYKFVEETITILNNIYEKELNLLEYTDFCQAFSRSQQYISFIKKIEYC